MMKHNYLFAAKRLKQLAIPILLVNLCWLTIFPTELWARVSTDQSTQQGIKINGVVRDDMGNPLPGVSILVKGGTNGTKTDEAGRYTLSVENEQQSLVFRYVGYLDKEILVSSQRLINVTMGQNVQTMDEVVVVGYGKQKKATLTGAVASVSNKEIVTTKNQNVQNMLTGKVPGLRVVQPSSEPGDFSNLFDIRGFGSPLIVVDGVPRGTISRIDPNEIESISVLKDAAAAVYGVRAANGVVLITTKRGEAGKAKITYAGYYGYQEAIGLPKPVGVIERYTLMNEKSMHNVNGGYLTYNDDAFAPYLDGTLKSVDWYDLVMKTRAPQYQHNLSASGSSKDNTIDYFINMGYTNQDGYWKSNSLNYERYNLRSNINAKITDRITASLKISGILENKKNPTKASWEIFKSLWRAQPNETYYANNNPDYLYQLVDMHPGAYVDDNVSGYAYDKNNWFQSQFSLDYKVPYIEGLLARGMFSYDTKFNDNTNYRKQFDVYHYDAASSTYLPYSNNGPDQLRRAYSTNPATLMQLSLNYTKNINNTHNISGLLLYEESTSSGDNFNGSRELGIPLPYLFAGISQNQVAQSDANGINKITNKGIVGKFSYDFKGKYLAEFNFRYDGSSKFPVGKQWGFFPSGSAGWRLSEESFIKDNPSLSFINNLKIRASYGVLGDDNASTYQFISGYDYPYHGNSLALASGYMFDGSFVNAIGFRNSPNPNITWYTSKMMNIGVDADLWDGKLGITADAFRRRRSGLLANRNVTVPGSFGTNMPQENLNSDETSGIELALSHRGKTSTLGYNVSGNISLTRTKNLYVERGRSGSAYDNWRNNNSNRYNDIWFGFDYAGQYQSYEEIANYPVFTGRSTLPGDYIYGDWNGDGVFDDMDKHPIATTINPNSSEAAGGNARKNYPLLTFGLNLGLDYKGFDLNLLFQGGAMSYIAYSEQLKEPLAWDGNALDVFMDRWHPVDPKADPYNPSTQWITGYYAYTGSALNDASRRAIQNGSYVRLKSAELGYSLPKSLLSKVRIQGVRFYVNAYNLFTITGVKGLDPEHPSELYGYMYPLSRTINLGTSVTF